MPNDVEYYDSSLRGFQIENALLEAKSLRTAWEAGSSGQLLSKTPMGYSFITPELMKSLIIGTDPPGASTQAAAGQLFFDKQHQLLYICTLVSGGIRTWKIVGSTAGGSYVFIKYSEVEPTSDEDMQDEPAAWMGIHSGNEAEAPIHYTDYQWNHIKGAQGDPGDKGDPGDPGVSPTVTVETITGGHRVTIYDEDHPSGQVFDVMDGTGSGDMTASVYDPNSAVANEGGIPNYVAEHGGGMKAEVYDPDSEVADAGGIPEYVNSHGGKIDTIKLNGEDQPIIDKVVSLETVETFVDDDEPENAKVGDLWLDMDDDSPGIPDGAIEQSKVANLTTDLAEKVAKLASGSTPKAYIHNGSTQSDLDIDSTPTSGSDHLITSGGVMSGLDAKVDATTLAGAIGANLVGYDPNYKINEVVKLVNVYTKSFDSNLQLNIVIPSNSRLFGIVFSAYSNTNMLFGLYSNALGAVTVQEYFKTSNITISTATNLLTFKCSNSGYMSIIALDGDTSVKSSNP